MRSSTSLLAWTLAIATAQCSPSCPSDNNKNVNITANDQDYTYGIACGLNIIGPDLARYQSPGLEECVNDCAKAGTACVGATYIGVVGDCVQKSAITEQLAYAASADAQSAVLVKGPNGFEQDFGEICGVYCT
ncbi:hypothetical protein DOTSEDRAFT_24695 [Dothistroma septosporum NZE10]|uniref:Apple domain-containing protein n=1 Tax=Dothistroma septosporum (strain NZE10 / CBS 128990) TaxID=675120 RepID=N1PMP4_DOTSN|nr:hypothetical protein DOTSEDRAFT_24695 [Dothistroma septosporum NZE10]